jgi:hypothetical protein
MIYRQKNLKKLILMRLQSQCGILRARQEKTELHKQFFYADRKKCFGLFILFITFENNLNKNI